MVARIKPIGGGDKALDSFIQALAKAPKTLDAISKNLAEETVGLVKEGFRQETDPYGVVWKPKKRPDGRKVLSGKTSNLKGGWHVVKSSKRGFFVAPSVDYAAPHQSPKAGEDGRLKRPKRAMVPDGRGLPTRWRKIYVDISKEVLEAHFAAAMASSSGGGASGGSEGQGSSSVNWRTIYNAVYSRITSNG